MNVIDCGQFTCEHVLSFQILCSLLGTGIFRCASIVDIFPLGINYIWFDGLLYVVACLIIFQVMLNFEFFFFIFQAYLECSVSFSYFLWLNDLLWLLYLSLDFVLVNPIFATFHFSEHAVTLNTMQLVHRQYNTEEGHRSVRKLWSLYYPFIRLKCHNYAIYLFFVNR